MGYQIMHNEKARLAAENAALENQGEMQRRRAECVTNMAERILSLEAENAALREQLAVAQKDAERLDFITSFGKPWFVQWEQKYGKPVRYRMIHDGEPEGGWYPTARAAIDAAIEKEKAE